MRQLPYQFAFLFASLRFVVLCTAAAQAPSIPVPVDYREWVFLSSGLDMTYTEPGAVGLTAAHASVFDNVFVNPEAYRSFKQTGHWPANTTFVLENRVGEGAVSINKAGKTQGATVTGLEIHTNRDGAWAFYVRAKGGTERLVAKPASCYTCHEAHAAVDTTYVQFYPTLLPVAVEKKTLSAEYLKELPGPDGSGASRVPVAIIPTP